MWKSEKSVSDWVSVNFKAKKNSKAHYLLEGNDIPHQQPTVTATESALAMRVGPQ